MNESFKGATFSELLKSKGIRDEILTLLIKH